MCQHNEGEQSRAAEIGGVITHKKRTNVPKDAIDSDWEKAGRNSTEEIWKSRKTLTVLFEEEWKWEKSMVFTEKLHFELR